VESFTWGHSGSTIDSVWMEIRIRLWIEGYENSTLETNMIILAKNLWARY